MRARTRRTSRWALVTLVLTVVAAGSLLVWSKVNAPETSQLSLVAWGEAAGGIRAGLEVVPGRPLTVAVRVRNTDGKRRTLCDAGWGGSWTVVFTPIGRGAAKRASCFEQNEHAPMDVAMRYWHNIEAVRMEISSPTWGFVPLPETGEVLRTLPAGAYGVTASYSHTVTGTGPPNQGKYWRGTVTTGQLNVEITDRLEAELSPRQVRVAKSAVETARKYCQGKLSIPDDCPVRVGVEKGRYVVTFVYVLPPGRLFPAPDYHAQVTIDADTGKVVKILAGS